MKNIDNKLNENSAGDHLNTLIDIVSNNKSELVVLEKYESISGKYSPKKEKLWVTPVSIYYSCSEKAITLKPSVGDTLLISQLRINSLKNKEELLGEDYLEKSREIFLDSMKKTSVWVNLFVKNKDYLKSSVLKTLSQKIKSKNKLLSLSEDFSNQICLPKEIVELKYKHYLSQFSSGNIPILNRDVLIDLIVKDISESDSYKDWHQFTKDSIKVILSGEHKKYLVKDWGIIESLINDEQKANLEERVNKVMKSKNTTK